MIEFDVLPEFHDAPTHGPLLLAHDYEHAERTRRRSRRASPTSPQTPFDGVELDVDLKLPGYEERVVDALRAHGLIERTLISTQYMRSLVVAPRARARPAARLVGPARARGLHAQSRLYPASGAAALRVRAPPAARRRGRPHRARGAATR